MSTIQAKTDKAHVITGPATRWSYVHVWEPRSVGEDAPKYSVNLLIPKDDLMTITKVQLAVMMAYTEGETVLRGNGEAIPQLNEIRLPLRDGDMEKPDDPVYKNMFFLYASSRFAPQIVDANINEVTDKNLIYSGVYGRASVTFFAYNNEHKGIGCRLDNLQYLYPGEYITNRKSAAEDFAEFVKEGERK